MKRKIIFAVLLVLTLVSLFSEPDGTYSIWERIAYKSFLFSFLFPLTVASAIWCKNRKSAKRLWSIAIIIAFIASFSIHGILPKDMQASTADTTKDDYSNSEAEFINEPEKPIEVLEDKKEITNEINSKVELSETSPEAESQVEELGKEPVSYTFNDEYTVGNVVVHINEIQVRQSIFKAGSHILEFRIFCELTNMSSSEQFFTATQTGNIVGVFYGKEETRIAGMDNLLWDKEDYNISTGTTIPANETKELVVQAGSIITDTITYDDELKFDIFFRNNDEMFTVSFDCQP